jgi:uncharacterized membrane protein required for colicin V production
MIQLAALLWATALFFGAVGYMRGVSKELIALAGIILGLFALFQFDSVLRGVLLATVEPVTRFYVQSIIFLLIVFFAYQTRALARHIGGSDGRDPLQSTVLGALVGFLNGYMIFGSLWYFMDINQYPLNPFISPPAAGTSSAQLVSSLPLYLLAGGPTGDGNLLSLAMILLFIIVLIVI